TNADSSGISLLDEEAGRFVWPAVVGGLEAFIGAGTPADFGPCGTVLDRNSVVLFSHPERHFTYLKPIAPSLEEVLLVPFHVSGKAVGTLWAVIHDPARQFDREDRRILESLSQFAASAYRVLTETGVLEKILENLPKHEPAGAN
ncbi:MAG: GAF domain-containing protein, partial [Verrucomicrobiaceae bacterium]